MPEQQRAVLSIVTICLDDEAGLRKTLNSLPSYGVHGYEHIIVDGGSSDQSLAIATTYAKNKDWVHVSSDVDDGIYDAMNKGLAKCRGRYVWFLNAGDEAVGPDVVELVVSKLKNSDRIWAMGHVIHGEINKRSTSLPFDNWKFWTGRQGYNHQGTLVSVDFLRSIGGHDTRVGFAADLHILAKAVAIGQPAEMNFDIAKYKGGGYSSTKVAGTPLEFHAIRNQLLDMPNPLRSLSYIYAIAQVARRHGLKIAIREIKKRRVSSL